MQILCIGNFIHIFFTHLFRCFYRAMRVQAIPVKGPDLPVFDHQLAFNAFVIEEAIREFMWQFTHRLEICQVLLIGASWIAVSARDTGVDLLGKRKATATDSPPSGTGKAL